MIQLSKTTISFGIIMMFIIIYVIFLLFIHLIDYRFHLDNTYNKNNQSVNQSVNQDKYTHETNKYENEENSVITPTIPNKVVQSTNLLTDSIETFGNSTNNTSHKINNPIQPSDLTPIDGYSTNENYIYGKYLEENGDNIVIDEANSTVCCDNHNHENCKCSYGPTNFPNPKNMNGIDRRIFKANYQDNMTIQDYVNWLFLFTDDESSLPYEHYKFYNELKKNRKLKYIKGICPPSARKINKPVTSNEYYKNLYDDLENSNFTKLIHESKIDITKAQDPKELNDEISKATEIHGKQLKGYNYLAYTRLDKYGNNMK